MKFITLETLQYFKTKLEGLFVKQEKKTGSDSEFKVLSDNNLTDELVQKINAAGTSSFSGSYTDLTAKPSINGHEVDGEMTLTDLGIDKVSAFANDANYQSDTEVTATVSTAKTEAVTEAKSYADTQIDAAKSELQTTINTKISTAYKIKGSTEFASLPALSEAEEGNVYNVTDAFTSTTDFVEGASKKYPAGSNVVCIEESDGVFKWDVLAGFIDTDVFVKSSDIETATEEEIDAMFAA